ncbi:MAG: MmcQ/YjbR family DNA-binding protein [Actinomycetota bacterium]
MGIRAATLRAFALGLPEAEERETWETATFRVRGKIFFMFSEHERHAWIKSSTDEQQALVAMDAVAFFVPPYVGPSGWVGAVVSKADGDELRELVTEAWRMTAPKRLLAVFDEGTG